MDSIQKDLAGHGRSQAQSKANNDHTDPEQLRASHENTVCLSSFEARVKEAAERFAPGRGCSQVAAEENQD